MSAISSLHADLSRWQEGEEDWRDWENDDNMLGLADLDLGPQPAGLEHLDQLLTHGGSGFLSAKNGRFCIQKLSLAVTGNKTLAKHTKVSIQWPYEAKTVFVTTSHDEFHSKTPLTPSTSDDVFEGNLSLPSGSHLLLFEVDGQVTIDPHLPVTIVRNEEFNILMANPDGDEGQSDDDDYWHSLCKHLDDRLCPAPRTADVGPHHVVENAPPPPAEDPPDALHGVIRPLSELRISEAVDQPPGGNPGGRPQQALPDSDSDTETDYEDAPVMTYRWNSAANDFVMVTPDDPVPERRNDRGNISAPPDPTLTQTTLAPRRRRRRRPTRKPFYVRRPRVSRSGPKPQ